MAAPLLGLASLLGREYANTLPDLGARNDLLKVVSPQTYYGNQLIQYLADKFNPEIGSGLNRAQNVTDYYGQKLHYDSRPENQLSQEEYNRQMAELSAQVNAPGSVEKFENYLRDADYGTISPNAQNFTGPQTEDSQAFQYGSDTFPVTVGQLPSESNFTPRQLEVLEQMLLGKSADMGPQPDAPDTPRRPDFTPEGSGSGYMPQDSGGYMPQGGGKGEFNIDDIEQYLRGGIVGRNRYI